jgi:hypothetical protein
MRQREHSGEAIQILTLIASQHRYKCTIYKGAHRLTTGASVRSRCKYLRGSNGRWQWRSGLQDELRYDRNR